ncbi:DNA-binding domain-containing protein [Aestuariicoccus sp. MJ-SS9]|uniref:DNA-binding domain-containing protein n=1 Tax=Aestuariicoccus sp. MJ-SS9 TaxID=3079855 RepID=UPI0029122A7A|nr:DNA-binding domain-containing protein [Aestuariicoccus sp. MJ-SS9]MDU8910285.1 DNA-binding domain-containing protein [Aestuariicoccus sp. MJ-SS9]
MTDQTAFRAALLDAARPVPEGLTDGAGRPAGRRYAVYRNNVAVSLREALATGFPAVEKLIGPENFANLAGLYLRNAPPVSPLMMHYGEGFGDFIADFQPLAHIGYLADVARLEMALRRSYHAADAAPADAAILADLTEPQLMAARLTLAPWVEVLRSPWPVVSVYAFTLQPGAPKPQAVAEDALILRPEFDPAPHVLPQGGADFIEALQRGETFGAALTAAGEGFDLAQTLNLILANGAVTDIIPGDT